MAPRQVLTDQRQQSEGQQQKRGVDPNRNAGPGHDRQRFASDARIGFGIAVIIHQQHRRGRKTKGEAGLDRRRNDIPGAKPIRAAYRADAEKRHNEQFA